MTLAKSSLLCFIIGLLPVPVIFWSAVIFPDLVSLRELCLALGQYSRVYSEYFYIASVLTSVWVMTGIFFGATSFILAAKNVRLALKPDVTGGKVAFGLIGLTLLMTVIITVAYVGKQNLSESWGALRTISKNSLLLFLYFLVSYTAYYSMGWLPSLYLTAVLKTLQKKT